MGAIERQHKREITPSGQQHRGRLDEYRRSAQRQVTDMPEISSDGYERGKLVLPAIGGGSLKLRVENPFLKNLRRGQKGRAGSDNEWSGGGGGGGGGYLNDNGEISDFDSTSQEGSDSETRYERFQQTTQYREIEGDMEGESQGQDVPHIFSFSDSDEEMADPSSPMREGHRSKIEPHRSERDDFDWTNAINYDPEETSHGHDQYNVAQEQAHHDAGTSTKPTESNCNTINELVTIKSLKHGALKDFAIPVRTNTSEAKKCVEYLKNMKWKEHKHNESCDNSLFRGRISRLTDYLENRL